MSRNYPGTHEKIFCRSASLLEGLAHLGLPRLSSCLPWHLIQLTTRWSLTALLLCSHKSDEMATKSTINLRPWMFSDQGDCSITAGAGPMSFFQMLPNHLSLRLYTKATMEFLSYLHTLWKHSLPESSCSRCRFQLHLATLYCSSPHSLSPFHTCQPCYKFIECPSKKSIVFHFETNIPSIYAQISQCSPSEPCPLSQIAPARAQIALRLFKKDCRH